jgi:hypothetical protein
MFPRVVRAVHAVRGACYEGVRMRRGDGNGADHAAFETQESPVVAAVRGLVNAAAARAERPAGGINGVRGARIDSHGHDDIVVMLADPAKKVPVFP